VYFHPSFTKYWHDAANWFGQKRQVTFWEFIEGLSAAWEVSPQRLVEHLPLILAVLTQKATMPEGMRDQMKLAPHVIGKLSDESLIDEIGMLSLGKTGVFLEARGIRTIGNLLESIRKGAAPPAKSSHGRVIYRSMHALARSASTLGKIDWATYASQMGSPSLPSRVSKEPPEFLERLAESLEEIIEVNQLSMRATQIFRLRIAVPRSKRLTLAQTAEKLDTHGPTVKREESIFLGALNDFLVEQDFTHSRATYTKEFLQFWQDASIAFRQSEGNFGVFCDRLAEQWEIAVPLLADPAETLWAVLSEYPRGRPRKPKASVRVEAIARAPTHVAEGGVVMLRGFRTVH